jgi:hypothetical protein
MGSKLTFDRVEKAHLRDCFLRAYQAFPRLHTHPLSLQVRSLPHYTMRAQPVFNRHFFRRATRYYRIQMSNHLQIAQHIPLAELPEEVLVGWFAHELGHLIDYQARSAINLVALVLGYFLSSTRRLEAERRADLFALERGFGQQLLATKRYLMEHATLPSTYKLRLQKYYLSPTELEVLIQEKEARILGV